MKVVIERTNKKIVKLYPQTDGSIKVLAYRRLGRKKIAKILQENVEWIVSHCKEQGRFNEVDFTLEKGRQKALEIEENSELKGRDTIVEIVTLRKVLLCGQLYVVKPSQNAQMYIQNDTLYISEKHLISKDAKRKSITTFLKKMCNNCIPLQIARFATSTNCCPLKVAFKDLAEQWCNCLDAGNQIVTLNYKIIQLPEHLQWYLVAHVFCHFTQKEHNNFFWNQVSNFIPNYKDCLSELKEYDFLLDI